MSLEDLLLPGRTVSGLKRQSDKRHLFHAFWTPTPPPKNLTMLNQFSSATKRSQEKWVFDEVVVARIYASLGCGAQSAKCTARSNVLGYLLLSWAWRWIMQETPVPKPPILSSRFLCILLRRSGWTKDK